MLVAVVLLHISVLIIFAFAIVYEQCRANNLVSKMSQCYGQRLRRRKDALPVDAHVPLEDHRGKAASMESTVVKDHQSWSLPGAAVMKVEFQDINPAFAPQSDLKSTNRSVNTDLEVDHRQRKTRQEKSDGISSVERKVGVSPVESSAGIVSPFTPEIKEGNTFPQLEDGSEPVPNHEEASPEISLPSERWQAIWSEADCMFYYHNSRTGVTTWEEPDRGILEMPGRKPSENRDKWRR